MAFDSEGSIYGLPPEDVRDNVNSTVLLNPRSGTCDSPRNMTFAENRMNVGNREIICQQHVGEYREEDMLCIPVLSYEHTHQEKTLCYNKE